MCMTFVGFGGHAEQVEKLEQRSGNHVQILALSLKPYLWVCRVLFLHPQDNPKIVTQTLGIN